MIRGLRIRGSVWCLYSLPYADLNCQQDSWNEQYVQSYAQGLVAAL